MEWLANVEWYWWFLSVTILALLGWAEALDWVERSRERREKATRGNSKLYISQRERDNDQR